MSYDILETPIEVRDVVVATGLMGLCDAEIKIGMKTIQQWTARKKASPTA
ncbi:MAG: hypothetical protein AAFY48_15975 [Bacteroidota bacterium]